MYFSVGLPCRSEQRAWILAGCSPTCAAARATFEEYVGEAFKPLGVYVNFWHPKLDANPHQVLDVMMVNDLPKPSRGKLVLALESPEGKQVVATEAPFTIPALGQMTYPLTLAIPHAPGKYLLKAAAHAETAEQGPTISRRKVSID